MSLVPLSGGTFLMGSDEGFFPEDAEGPVRNVQVAPFAIASRTVTNAEFAEFVRATGYTTDAEHLGSSFVFGPFVRADLHAGVRSVVPETPWWVDLEGACWSAPEGRNSTIDSRLDHPVVHVSHRDALAYCAWSATRLPSEAEWEYAARGGLEQQRYPWGNELKPDGHWLCNIWQGDFPNYNSADDGFVGTAPVDAFPPNAYGLFNTVGNVWEWSATRFGADGEMVMRGGSYLCHASYCFRYRVAARSGNAPLTSTGHLGFRVAS